MTQVLWKRSHLDDSPRIAGVYPESPQNANLAALSWQKDTTLQTIRQSQLDAFWNAPQTAHDWHILAAIHAAWDSMEAGQP